MFSSRKSAAPAAAGGYTIAKSLRFRSSASAYLNRTPASAGNRQIWTYSGWVKRGQLGTQQALLNTYAGSHPTCNILFGDTNGLWIYNYNGSSYDFSLYTTAVYRDPSAWYHIVVAVDTTQSTSTNRVKMYVNGVQITSFSTSPDSQPTSYPSLNFNTDMNAATAHEIGKQSTLYFDGYLAEQYLIDGQALTPTSFGATNAATGVWQPIAYTGTYGTNGFYLKFTDTTSTSTLGNDSSGNNNTWTVNNISLTSGSTYDSMTDVPTNTSATVANYCVLNPLVTPATTTIINGNLGLSGYTAFSSATGTIGVSSGKWYFEFIAQANAMSGITGTPNGSNYPGQAANSYAWDSANTTKYNNNSGASYGSATSAGDIVGVAFDLDSGSITFYKNNVSQGTAYTFTPSGAYFPVVRNGDTTNTSVNFGQRPFSYTPPSGYVALNTFNLPTPTIGATASTQANKYFDISLYTGTGATQSITGLGFQPDFTWIKKRNSTSFSSHQLVDAVRGTSAYLFTDSTNAEATATDRLTAFNSNGFTLSTASQVNGNTDTFVAWNWDANGAGSSNTAGSITSTVSANTTAGFSIVTYTGNQSAGATVGHGLGVAPSMIIIKCRGAVTSWPVYHASLGATQWILLNSTNAAVTSNQEFNNTAPTSTVFSIGNSSSNSNQASTYVAYCFAEVAGYSAFGSYTGNGSTDGPFVFCGFRPKFVMIKCTNIAGSFWVMQDTVRNTYNVINSVLYPNSSAAEATTINIDALSNGFKLRTLNSDYNNSGSDTYIYAAFAESPFKYANAR